MLIHGLKGCIDNMLCTTALSKSVLFFPVFTVLKVAHIASNIYINCSLFPHIQCNSKRTIIRCFYKDLFGFTVSCTYSPLPPIDTIWAMMIVWRTRGDYRTARAVLEAIIAFSAVHTYYEQLLQVKQIFLCLTGFTSLCLDAYVFLCSLVFHCMHVVLL